MKKSSRSLFAAITLAFAGIAVLASAPATAAELPSTCVPVSRDSIPWWKERNAAFNATAQARNAKIVFLGDSITHNWEKPGKATWEKFFEPLDAVNFGCSGDRTEHVLWRIENGNFAGKMNPKLIVLMIGTNNWNDPAEATAQGVKKILAALKKSEPQAKILLLAIFPRGATKVDAKRQKNEAVNALIKKYADGRRVFWKDINAVFLEKDKAETLPRSVMPDLLHPNAEGHRRWAEAVLPTVKKLSR